MNNANAKIVNGQLIDGADWEIANDAAAEAGKSKYERIASKLDLDSVALLAAVQSLAGKPEPDFYAELFNAPTDANRDEWIDDIEGRAKNILATIAECAAEDAAL